MGSSVKARTHQTNFKVVRLPHCLENTTFHIVIWYLEVVVGWLNLKNRRGDTGRACARQVVCEKLTIQVVRALIHSPRFVSRTLAGCGLAALPFDDHITFHVTGFWIPPRLSSGEYRQLLTSDLWLFVRDIQKSELGLRDTRDWTDLWHPWCTCRLHYCCFSWGAESVKLHRLVDR